MKILITGADGFVGKNLISALRVQGYDELQLVHADTPMDVIDRYTTDCGFVYHLASQTRARHDEFLQGDFTFTDALLRMLLRHKNRCPVMYASSLQAALPNLYGRSKKAGEELLFQYERESGAKVYVFRLPSLFGKWSRPSAYNAVATYCYNASHDIEIATEEDHTPVTLGYIEDAVEALLALLDDKPHLEGSYCTVAETYSATLPELAAQIRSFRRIRKENKLPDFNEPLTRKLYATYVSFLPTMEFAYPLDTRENDTGGYTEFLCSSCGGQFTVHVTKPGGVQGNHWHGTRTEKFLVVSGAGVIRFRREDMSDVIEYHVSAKKLAAVDVPVGYVHSIENTGKTDLVTLIWSSECSHPDHPDCTDAGMEQRGV